MTDGMILGLVEAQTGYYTEDNTVSSPDAVPFVPWCRDSVALFESCVASGKIESYMKYMGGGQLFNKLSILLTAEGVSPILAPLEEMFESFKVLFLMAKDCGDHMSASEAEKRLEYAKFRSLDTDAVDIARPEPDRDPKYAIEYCQEVNNVARRRRTGLISIPNGGMGDWPSATLCLLPDRSSTGDVVCVLPGSKVPFVLRKRPSDAYELIGECYTLGHMCGEAFGLKSTERIVIEQD